MIRYLTGHSGDAVRRVAKRHSIGLLVTPDTDARAKYRRHLLDYPFWAADNACFNHPDAFDVEAYLAWLASFSREERYVCAWAPAPDVLGDCRRTLERSLPVLPRIRALGVRAALVAQDGLESHMVPWHAVDCVFLGGTTAWKLSGHARALVDAAKREGKLAHMGRVNSLERLRVANRFGCDTADGTFLAFAPDHNLPRLLSWYRTLEREERKSASAMRAWLSEETERERSQ